MVLSNCRISGSPTYENNHVEGGTNRQRGKTKTKNGESKANPLGSGCTTECSVVPQWLRERLLIWVDVKVVSP
jgi:hypothetical protein